MVLRTVSALVSEVGDVPEGRPRIDGRLEDEHILVPLLATDVPVVTDQLRVAASLARTSGTSLHVLSPRTGTDQTVSKVVSDLTAGAERELVEWATDQVTAAGRGLGYTHELVSGVLESVRANDVETLVVPSDSVAGRFRRGLTDRIALHTDCDVITVNGRQGYEQVPSILLAVADGAHSTLATDVAERVATDCDAWVDILHVVEEDAPESRRDRADACVEAAARRIGRPDLTTTWVLEADDIADAIIEQSAYYGLTVIGAPTKGRLRQFVFGSTNRTIRSGADSVVLSARQRSLVTDT